MNEGQDNFFDRILQNRLLSHVSFWLLMLLSAPLTSSLEVKTLLEAFIFRSVAMPMKIIPTYFFVYYLVPKFFHTKKYFTFIVLFFLSSILFTIIYRFNNVHIAETLAGLDAPKESLFQIIYEVRYTFLFYFFRIYYATIVFILLKAFKDREVKKRQIDILEKEKTKAELNFLKAQIHPHFLFNTLNNLYVLTLEKSDEAPEVVAKLSEMLDYILYQCKDSKVLLSKEVELIQNYIALEKLRYGNRLQLTFDYPEETSQQMIAPLILISVIENAFKHGVSTTIEEGVINISLQIENNQLHFQVFNTKANDVQYDVMDYKKGIGVKNIKRQLELIYPNEHQLIIEEKPESYQVNLNITL